MYVQQQDGFVIIYFVRFVICDRALPAFIVEQEANMMHDDS
jgi:hypothetical protein